jgi:hypothetical protein
MMKVSKTTPQYTIVVSGREYQMLIDIITYFRNALGGGSAGSLGCREDFWGSDVEELARRLDNPVDDDQPTSDPYCGCASKPIVCIDCVNEFRQRKTR